MRFNTSHFLTFFFLLLSLSVAAQISISGRVIAEDKTPIPYATVVLTHIATDAFITGTTTIKDGNFKIESSKSTSVKITISFIGFESYSTIVNKTKHIDSVVLIEASNDLEEVVLEGTKSAITKKGDQLIFNVQSTPLKVGYNGIEILKVTPNVWVDANDAILMRDQAARILINGRRINMSGNELSNYISNLTSENILRVEVQTNQSANTSAESTGGIINIILKQQSLGIRGQLKGYYANRGEGYDITYTGLTATYGSEKWNLYGLYNIGGNETFNVINNVVNFSEIERINTTFRNKESEITRQNYQFGFVTSISELHELGLEVFGTHSKQSFNDLGAVTYQENDLFIDTGRNDILGKANTNRFNSVLNYKWNVSPKDKLTVFVDYLKSENNGLSSVNNVYQNGTVINSENRYTPDAETDVYAIQADYSKSLESELNLDFGIKYTETDRNNNLLSEFRNDLGFSVNPEETTNLNYKENISAGYLSASKTVKEKNYFKFGLRVENTTVSKKDFITNSLINQDYNNWFPSLYYSRTLGNRKTISASFSRSLRRPSFRDLNDNITKINDFQFVLGNPDLNPEFVTLYEISYDVKGSGFSTYYKDTNDAINGIYFVEDDIAFYKKFNDGSQVQYGIQFNTSKKMKSWWYTRFSSHLYNRKFVNDVGVSSFEKTTISARLFNTFTLSKTMSIDLSGRYTSPKADAFYEAAEIYTANILLKKSFLEKKLNLRLYFDDIFNSLQYKNVRQFNTFSTTADDKPRSRKIMFWLTYDISNNKKVLAKKNKSKNTSRNRL